jgi:hypothetical protein
MTSCLRQRRDPILCAATLCVLAAPALAQDLELRPHNPAAIYESGATVGWTVVPRGAHAGGA